MIRFVFRSRAAAKGHCATDYSNVPAYAKVQFDNRLEEQGGVDPQIDVDEDCWNYKLDTDVACVDNPHATCVTFGLLMGPSNCQTGDPDSYCVLGHSETGSFVTRLQTVTDPNFDPVISVLLTDIRKDDTFSLLFGSFPGGMPAAILSGAGFELYNAPWLLHVTGAGPSSWNDPSDNVLNYNRTSSYRTVGSWLFSDGDAPRVTSEYERSIHQGLSARARRLHARLVRAAGRALHGGVSGAAREALDARAVPDAGAGRTGHAAADPRIPL